MQGEWSEEDPHPLSFTSESKVKNEMKKVLDGRWWPETVISISFWAISVKIMRFVWGTNMSVIRSVFTLRCCEHIEELDVDLNQRMGLTWDIYSTNRPWDSAYLSVAPVYKHSIHVLYISSHWHGSSLPSTGSGIRWCFTKGFTATGSFWNRHRNFHYNDLGCGVPGMHVQ